MVQGRPIEKRLRGRKITQREYREAIIDTLRLFGETGASGAEIAEEWGELWPVPENRLIINKTLINMAERGVLRKASRRGRYVVNETRVAELGTSQGEATERQIINFMISRGGFATLHQIAEHFGVEEVDDKSDPDRDPYTAIRKRDPVYAAIETALKRSKIIRRDFYPHIQRANGDKRTRNYWHLSRDYLDLLPRTGYITGALIRCALNLGDASVDAEIATEATFARIASVVVQTMEAKGIDYAKMAEVEPAFETIMRDWNRLYPAVKRMNELAEAKLGVDYFSEAAFRIEQEFADTADARLFQKFIDGEGDAHTTAPLDFYYALGRVLGLNAAALSRGYIEPAYPSSSELSDEA